MSDIINDRPTDRAERAPRARADEVRQERRRREDTGTGRRMRLSVSGKDSAFEYRWINDSPGRVHQLTVEDDWDVVKAGDNKRNVSVGTADERVVDANGRKAILVRKRKDFYQADKAKEQGFVDQRESGLRRGTVPGDKEQSDPGGMYVPQGGITIGRDG